MKDDTYQDEQDDSDLDYLADIEGSQVEVAHRNIIRTGDEVNITYKDPTINELLIGVGWELKKFDEVPLDLDVSIFLLGNDNKTRIDEDFVFYNNMIGCDGAVKHMGDSRTGAGDGDDENAYITLNNLPFDVSRLSFVLSIYDMDFAGHNFSMVRDVYFRLVNKATDHEIFRYELDKELVGNEGLEIGYLERIGSEWVFHAVGETVEGGLGKIAENYGISVLENMK